MNHRLLPACLLLAATAATQTDATSTASHVTDAVRARTGWPFANVIHDEPGDGRLWACGATWKASFGAEGFTYHPRFGASAPSQPLHFRVTAVRVGGQPVPLPAEATPSRSGDVVTFDRGALREVYNLALEQVEQTFVVTTADPGDIEVELAVTSPLAERAATAGIQFASEYGEVDYGSAFLVLPGRKLPIESACTDGTIRLRVGASQRDGGPVVIDPIITTRSTSVSGAVTSPDTAYDVTNDRYLVVWESAFSTTDHDIWTEMFNGQGERIVGSGAAIDMTAQLFLSPRTANLDAADRFLVATELADAAYGGRRMVYGRTRDAGGATALGSHVLLSNPNVPGDNYGPEVGADPATGSGPHDWLVVWTNVASSSDANIHGRAVTTNGQPKHSWVLVIEDGVNTYNANVQVSRSNGNGQVPHVAWLVVYNRHLNSNTTHVLGRTLDLGFNLGIEQPLADSNARNLYPQVSSPIQSRGETSYLVTYEQSGGVARGVVVHFAPAWRGTHYFNLTSQFGMIGTWVRAESDGVRFVVACQGPFAGEIVLSTLGWTGYGLTLLDGPWSLGSAAAQPELAACRASGGALGQYGVAWLQGQATNAVPRLTRYGGYASGTMTSVLPTMCHGLAIQQQGSPLLGDEMRFSLPNPGADLPGFAFGWPAATPLPICPQCSLGLRLDGPIDLQLGTAALLIRIPLAPSYVGLSFAVQGLGVGSGTCYGSLRMSDTVQFNIR